jgi:hypothetical protein
MMRTVRRLLDWINRAFERPLVGLPLRMVFLCSWHRIHFTVIAAMGALAGLAWLIDRAPGWWLAGALAAPSAACIAMLFPLGLSLLFLEWVSGYQPEGPP